VLEQLKRNQPVYGLSYRGTADGEAFGEFALSHELVTRLDASLEDEIAQLFKNQV
jgi:hypothetical protein